MIFVTNDDVMGKNIRYYRCGMGLSRSALAELTGLREWQIMDLEEDNTREIPGDALEKLCEVFHTCVQSLVENRNI